MNFVKVDILVTFHHTGMSGDVHTKIILTFLAIVYHFHRRRTCVWFRWQHKIHSMFIVSRPSAEIELGIQGLLIVVGKLEIHALEN